MSCAAPTLDAIFRANVRRTPDAPAVIDPPDRASFMAGRPLHLAYIEVDRAVDRLAARLRDLDLRPGAVVATQLPNTVESIVTLLALWRAELVAAPLPLLWREAEATQALQSIDARALIVGHAIAGTDHAAIACGIAAGVFSIRHVCSFGDGGADGIVPLDDIFADAPTPASAEAASAAGRPRVVTFDMRAEGPVPVVRADAQLLTGGFAIVAECGVPQGAHILACMLPSSFAVLATTVVPWLIAGGTLRLHHPFTGAALAAQWAQPHDVAVVPGALLPLLPASGARRHVLGLWRAPEQQALSPPWNGPDTVTDVLAFGEIGIVPRRRTADGLPAALTAGAVSVGAERATAIATLTRNQQGMLVFSGPMAPLGSAGGGETGHACQIDPATQALVLGAPPGGLAQIGGYRIAMAALQEVLGRADARGVLAALPDLLAGQKLAGAATDPARMRQTLAALGLSPLVSNAFRDSADRDKGAA
jgi:hypothetical protein